MRKCLGAAVTALVLLSVTAAQAAPLQPPVARLPLPHTTPDTSSATVKNAVLPKGDGSPDPAPDPLANLREQDDDCPSFLSGPGAWLTCKLKGLAAALYNSLQLAVVTIVAAFAGAFFPAIDALFGMADPLAPKILRPWTYSLILGGLLFAVALVWDAYQALGRGTLTAGRLAERARLYTAGLVLGAASLFLSDYLVVFQNQVWSQAVIQADPARWNSGAAGGPPRWLFARILAPEAAGLLDKTASPAAAAVGTAFAFYGVDPQTAQGLDKMQGFLGDTGNGLVLTIILLVLLVWLGFIGLIRTLALPVLAIMGPAYCMGAALWPTRDPVVGYASMVIRAVFVQSVVGLGFVLLSLARSSSIFSAWGTGLLAVAGLYLICRVSWQAFAAPVLTAVRTADFTLGGARVTDGLGRLGERAGSFLSALGVVRGDPALAARGARLQGISQALRAGAAERAEAVRDARKTTAANEKGAGGGAASAIRALLARRQETAAALPDGEVPARSPVSVEDTSRQAAAEGYPTAYDLARDPVEFIKYKAAGHAGQAVRNAASRLPGASRMAAAKEKVSDLLHPVSNRAAEIQARLAAPVRYAAVQPGGKDKFGRELTRVVLPSDAKTTEDIRSRLGTRLANPAAVQPGGMAMVFGSQDEVTKLVAEAEAPHRPRLARKVFAWRASDGRLVINDGGVPRRVGRAELPVAEEDLDIIGEWDI